MGLRDSLVQSLPFTNVKTKLLRGWISCVGHVDEWPISDLDNFFDCLKLVSVQNFLTTWGEKELREMFFKKKFFVS